MENTEQDWKVCDGCVYYDRNTIDTRGADVVIEECIQKILSGEIPFPYYRTFCLSIDELVKEAAKYKTITNTEPFRLRSYHPPNNLFLPAGYKGKPLAIISGKYDYTYLDILTDSFPGAEEHRLKNYHVGYPAPETEWANPETLRKIVTSIVKGSKFMNPKEVNSRTLRNTFSTEVLEAKPFRLCWLLGLIRTLEIKSGARWLDISSGNGDRAIAAALLGLNYYGCDPDLTLKPIHDAIIKRLGDPKKQEIDYRPFEEKRPPGKFDFVLSSPPFFDKEIYQGAEQSLLKYNNFTAWMVKFLFRSLTIAWEALNDGGVMAIDMVDCLDSEKHPLSIIEPMNLFIEECLPRASFGGSLGIGGWKGEEGKGGNYRGVWIWQKQPHGEKVFKWKPHVKRSLKVMYPELYRAMNE